MPEQRHRRSFFPARWLRTGGVLASGVNELSGDRAPLRSHPRIGEIANEMNERVPITGKRSKFFRSAGLKLRNMRGKFRVRNAGVTVVDSVIGLVEEAEGDKSPHQSLGNDAAG